VGAFTVWKIYERWHNRDFLEWAYPRLKKFHEWWFANRGDGQPFRDGNRDGLLEWGSDRGSSPTVGGRGMLQAAKWESGMDDSPMWDDASYDAHTYTMTQDDVGLNSLYAADAECLAKIATILGKEDEARHFSEEYGHIKRLIQTELWNPADGIYESRLWDGSFSKRLSPTNFYPMFAGIATPEQAGIMVNKHLLNPDEFWGTYVFPSIARNDRSFDDQFYWRGNIWGATNYLVYLGLNRYHFDQVAFDVAQKSYNLFMGDWNQNHNYDEQYSASGGGGGGETHYMWSGVLLLMPLEQYMDADYWGGGLRFGALAPTTTGTLHNVTWEGHKYDISIGPNVTSFSRDGKPSFQADGGIVIRDYTLAESGLSFKVHASKAVRISIQEFEAGTFSLSIDRRESAHTSVQEGKLTFTVPAGEHEVDLRK
jgi:glycogen debranching enzyme